MGVEDRLTTPVDWLGAPSVLYCCLAQPHLRRIVRSGPTLFLCFRVVLRLRRLIVIRNTFSWLLVKSSPSNTWTLGAVPPFRPVGMSSWFENRTFSIVWE